MADVLERMQDVLSAPNAPGPPRAFDPTDPAAALDPNERPAAMTPTQRYGMTASGVMTRRGGARPAPAPTRALAPAAPAAPAWSPYSYAPVAPTAQPAGPQPYSLGKGYNVVPPSQPGGSWLLADPRGRVTAHATQSLAESSVPPTVARSITPTNLTGAAAGVGGAVAGAVAGAVLASNPAQAMMGGEHGAVRADIVNKSRLSSDLGPGMPLDAAQQMEKQGKDPQTIFQVTGWYHAPDEKWKWILHDSDAKLNRDAFLVYRTGGSGESMGPKEQAEFDATHPERFDLRPGLDGAKISQVFDHPDLYALYPELKNATVSRLPREVTQATGAVADYNPDNNSVRLAPGTTEQDLLINLKHELQHGIQASEEFGPGTGLERYYPPGVTRLKPGSPEYQKAFDDYYRTSGEVEARQGSAEPNQDQLPTEMPGYPAPADQLVVHPGFLSGSILGNLISGDKIVPGVSYKPVDHDPFALAAPPGTPMTLTPVEGDPHDPSRYAPVDHDPFAMPDSSHYQLPQQNQVPLPVVPAQPTAALSSSGPDSGNTNPKWSWGSEYAAPAPNNPAEPQNIALNITQPQDYPNYAQAY